ncbi:MAG: bifunctional diaminohydroxyphosphoribosylaminopyrimidine deaminase/5-amino-6-(5-phosphoribosylamino)uracil reductase RibD [Alphaproteobacteria bacterium]
MTGDDQDTHFMRHALRLARRAAGRTWPNPHVGCVIVRPGPDGAPVIAGRGATAQGGRPHAETIALAQAGDAARGATAYVSFEPCAHHGQTPPCANALIEAGVARVVCALGDPDPRVNGRGLGLLREAGIEVRTGVLEAEARRVAAGFLSRIERGRPLVTLKLATSLDGRIATASGHSRWITGPEARARGHLLRARHDAILIGSGTALADDPALTCRLPGLEARSPVRVVMDGQLRLPPDSALACTARETPVWLVTRAGHEGAALSRLKERGVNVIEIEGPQGAPLEPAHVLSMLAERGITRLLVEGGARVASAFWKAHLVDRVIWFRAPLALGGDSRPAIEALNLAGPDAAPRLTRRAVHACGEDMVETYDVRT